VAIVDCGENVTLVLLNVPDRDREGLPARMCWAGDDDGPPMLTGTEEVEVDDASEKGSGSKAR
jgi:hypothetical protein